MYRYYTYINTVYTFAFIACAVPLEANGLRLLEVKDSEKHISTFMDMQHAKLHEQVCSTHVRLRPKKNLAPFPCTKGHFKSAAAPWGPQYGLWSQRFPCSATGSGYPIHTNATWHSMTFWVESLHPGCGVLQDLRYTSFISLNFKA